MAYKQIDSNKIVFEDSECHKFNDRYEGFLVLLNEGWVVEIWEVDTGASFYPVEPVSDPFNAMKYAETWVQVTCDSDRFKWEIGKRQASVVQFNKVG